jgi:fluoride ion exporter CrcB/FEX
LGQFRYALSKYAKKNILYEFISGTQQYNTNILFPIKEPFPAEQLTKNLIGRCSYFTFVLGFFHFLFHAEAANRKQTVNIATRGTTGIRM